VLGTLGSFFNEFFSTASLLLRFLFSPFDLVSVLEELDEACTGWPAGVSLGPLSGLEGLDEEHRRWCPRQSATAVALGVEDEREERRCD
jgi:hypothetical protein